MATIKFPVLDIQGLTQNGSQVALGDGQIKKYDTYSNLPQVGERNYLYIVLDEAMAYIWDEVNGVNDYVRLKADPSGEGSGGTGDSKFLKGKWSPKYKIVNGNVDVGSQDTLEGLTIDKNVIVSANEDNIISFDVPLDKQNEEISLYFKMNGSKNDFSIGFQSSDFVVNDRSQTFKGEISYNQTPWASWFNGYLNENFEIDREITHNEASNTFKLSYKPNEGDYGIITLTNVDKNNELFYLELQGNETIGKLYFIFYDQFHTELTILKNNDPSILTIGEYPEINFQPVQPNFAYLIENSEVSELLNGDVVAINNNKTQFDVVLRDNSVRDLNIEDVQAKKMVEMDSFGIGSFNYDQNPDDSNFNYSNKIIEYTGEEPEYQEFYLQTNYLNYYEDKLFDFTFNVNIKTEQQIEDYELNPHIVFEDQARDRLFFMGVQHIVVWDDVNEVNVPTGEFEILSEYYDGEDWWDIGNEVYRIEDLFGESFSGEIEFQVFMKNNTLEISLGNKTVSFDTSDFDFDTSFGRYGTNIAFGGFFYENDLIEIQDIQLDFVKNDNYAPFVQYKPTFNNFGFNDEEIVVFDENKEILYRNQINQKVFYVYGNMFTVDENIPNESTIFVINADDDDYFVSEIKIDESFKGEVLIINSENVDGTVVVIEQNNSLFEQDNNQITIPGRGAIVKSYGGLYDFWITGCDDQFGGQS